MTDRDRQQEREREHERETGAAERMAAIAAARDLGIMLVLVGGAIAMAITDHGDLALAMASGALTYAAPTVARVQPPRLIPPQIVALGVGLGALSLFS